jgi:hypothetical protein
MAKIAEIVRPNAAQRIATERAAVAEIEREIAELEQQRTARLVSDDDPAEALKLAGRIAEAYRRLETRFDRIKALESHGRRERTNRRQQQKAEALATFEKGFADRSGAAARLDKAIAEFAGAVSAYQEACRKPFASWSRDLFPDIRLYEATSYNYAGSRIAAALRMQSPGAAHALLTGLPARLGKFEDQDRERAASLIEDIRNAPLPAQPEIEEAA